ncbi:ribose-5-phosphate isomerase [Kineococcus sp. R8]|uniref:ribose-5-phosphate isomerase n=1 Tax=Kineococcus siccus TaxID=2696567 RepID=UPI0014136E08|nr:ribose-5-phosphate isomerase [Kineococcus siccus]NAZ80850.1 ribose-5-phosphate isomerase [Kineococcus siccus]
MRVHLGTDHAAFELKQHLVAHLRGRGHEVVDHGAPELDPTDDYPPFVLRAAAAVAADPGSLGIVLGGSGNGEQIAANAVPGIRCALAWSVETARLAREHNDAQCVGIGARMHTLAEATAIADAFVDTPFSQNPRHVRRLRMLTDYAGTGELPPLPGT